MTFLRNILLLLSLLFIENTCAQINPPIPNPRKIIFTYKTVPNFHFENNAVYADTFLLKKEFPRIKYDLKKSPTDTTKIVGCITKDKFNADEIKNFRSLLFHSFYEKKTIYNVKSKTAETSGSLCKSEECQTVYRLFFNDQNMTGTDFLPSEIKFYDTKKTIVNRGQYHYNETKYKDTKINWSPDFEYIGTYEYISKKDNYKYTNAVIVDPSLDRHISPISLFENCNFGVREVISKYTTTTLISVEYK